MKQQNSIGQIWFTGIVEDLDDPTKSGRVRVRIPSEHFDKVPKEDLLWAIVLMPATSASKEGEGLSPTGLAIGTNVAGFYLDGAERTAPLVVGSFHLPKRGGGNSDVSKIARGEGAVQKQYLSYEPKSPYAALYPHNKTFTTERGHVIEIDDTPKAERIHIYHKSGAYIEIGPEGDIVTKSPKNNTEITVKDKKQILDTGNYTLNTKQGDMSIKADLGMIEMESLTGISVTSELDITLTSTTTVTIQAPEILLIGDVSVE